MMALRCRIQSLPDINIAFAFLDPKTWKLYLLYDPQARLLTSFNIYQKNKSRSFQYWITDYIQLLNLFPFHNTEEYIASIQFVTTLIDNDTQERTVFALVHLDMLRYEVIKILENNPTISIDEIPYDVLAHDLKHPLPLPILDNKVLALLKNSSLYIDPDNKISSLVTNTYY